MKTGTSESVTELFNMVIRISKADAAFTYFQLEANEGLCFYSTLGEPGQGYRDIELSGTIEFEEEVLRLLKKLRESYPIEILRQRRLADSANAVGHGES